MSERTHVFCKTLQKLTPNTQFSVCNDGARKGSAASTQELQVVCTQRQKRLTSRGCDTSSDVTRSDVGALTSGRCNDVVEMLPKLFVDSRYVMLIKWNHLANFWLVGKVISVRSCSSNACQLQQISVRIKSRLKTASISVDMSATTEDEQNV